MDLSPVPAPVTVPDRSAPSRRTPPGHPAAGGRRQAAGGRRQAAGGLAYQGRSIAPEDKEDGGEPRAVSTWPATCRPAD
ncbi:hypothetical protein [Streptomyces sp. NPDC048496]|uniref:hypothetical protein n=1 Tax=Streptomyces sp. NPDC048496 TaxID=3365558 RepID=UPI0037156427